MKSQLELRELHSHMIGWGRILTTHFTNRTASTNPISQAGDGSTFLKSSAQDRPGRDSHFWEGWHSWMKSCRRPISKRTDFFSRLLVLENKTCLETIHHQGSAKAAKMEVSKPTTTFKPTLFIHHMRKLKKPSSRFSIAGCLFVPGIVHSP